MNKYGLY